MASTSSSAARAPLAAVSENKRSVDDAAAKPSSSLSPYKQRLKQLEDYRKTKNDNIIMFMSDDILECIPGKLEELEVEELEELEDRNKAYDSLTQEQVDKYLQVMVVNRKLCQLQREYYNKIMFSDPRNDEGCGILMLNTYSSWCMYPVIQKLLTAATKEINKAKKAVEAAGNSSSTKDLAAEAFNKAFSTILACDDMDHWRMDTESQEDCVKVAKKVSKIASDLLWFDDAELGLVDPYSRKSMLKKLESIHNEWNDIGGVKYKSPKNGQGLGRSHAPPPPAKKLKKTHNTVVATTTSTSNNKNDNLVTFLNAIQAKKKLREKTCVQLKVQSVVKPEKNVVVVLSGATDVKKLNQLCAYVTGHSPSFEFHSQRGTCIKGSLIELQLQEAKMWLAAKSLAKQAAKQGVAHVEDKQVKIIQVFQGLNTSPPSGIVYDSDQARSVKAYWVTPDNERYEITVQAVIANKCMGGKPLPMPRLVKDSNEYIPNLRTGFGKNLYTSNRYLQGNRQGPTFYLLDTPSPAELQKMCDNCASRSIANQDGTVDADKYVVKFKWTPQNVATAGPPS